MTTTTAAAAANTFPLRFATISTGTVHAGRTIELSVGTINDKACGPVRAGRDHVAATDAEVTCIKCLKKLAR